MIGATIALAAALAGTPATVPAPQSTTNGAVQTVVGPAKEPDHDEPKPERKPLTGREIRLMYYRWALASIMSRPPHKRLNPGRREARAIAEMHYTYHTPAEYAQACAERAAVTNPNGLTRKQRREAKRRGIDYRATPPGYASAWKNAEHGDSPLDDIRAFEQDVRAGRV